MPAPFLLLARLNKNLIVVTRPQSQAGSLALRLIALGRDVCVFPLLDIQPLSDPTHLKACLNRLADYAIVAFVSPNAVDAAFAFLPKWPSGVAAAVVGEGSRQALAKHGVTDQTAKVFSPIDAQRTDSETLLEVLDLPALAGKKVLIIRAETGRELLADRLREAGVTVDQVAAYSRGSPPLDAGRRQELSELLAQGCDWVITSSEALRNLKEDVEQVAGAAGWQQIRQATLVVPHVRIAETAKNMGFEQVILTASGDEALIAAIQSRS
jgi:uroporphyrinogen-III synthase